MLFDDQTQHIPLDTIRSPRQAQLHTTLAATSCWRAINTAGCRHVCQPVAWIVPRHSAALRPKRRHSARSNQLLPAPAGEPSQRRRTLSPGPECPGTMSSAGTGAGSRHLPHHVTSLSRQLSCCMTTSCSMMPTQGRAALSVAGQSTAQERLRYDGKSLCCQFFRPRADSDTWNDCASCAVPRTCRILREEPDCKAEHHPPPVVDLVGLRPPEEPGRGHTLFTPALTAKGASATRR